MASSTDITPKPTVWIGESGYRALETEFKRINEYFQLARAKDSQDWPAPGDERTLSPAEQSRLEIRFGVINPDPATAPAAKSKSKAKKNARKR